MRWDWRDEEGRMGKVRLIEEGWRAEEDRFREGGFPKDGRECAVDHVKRK